MKTLLTIDQVCELIPGMTRDKLAQMRFQGTGPAYFKPTPRLVIYSEEELIDWLQSTKRIGTAVGANS